VYQRYRPQKLPTRANDSITLNAIATSETKPRPPRLTPRTPAFPRAADGDAQLEGDGDEIRPAAYCSGSAWHARIESGLETLGALACALFTRQQRNGSSARRRHRVAQG
jgi:hypothetical protein